MPNYLIRLAFVGTNFHGWQVQPGLRTVQGELLRALSTVFKKPVKVVGCCRTDAGVHALDYVANAVTPSFLEPDKLLKALNALLPKDVGVKEVKPVEPSFNARYAPEAKVYLYKLWLAPYRDPFYHPFVWPVRRLNEELLRKLAKKLEGERDFAPFAKIEERDALTRVKLESVSVERKGELLELRFKAKSFLRYMVRRMVGLLVGVATGRFPEELFYEVLEGKKKAPYTAPPQGLHLEKVLLPPDAEKHGPEHDEHRTEKLKPAEALTEQHHREEEREEGRGRG